MATEEELYKIVVKAEGQAEVARLTAEVDKQEAEIRQLIAALKAGAVSQAQYGAATHAAAAQIASANAQIAATQKSIGNSKWGQTPTL